METVRCADDVANLHISKSKASSPLQVDFFYQLELTYPLTKRVL